MEKKSIFIINILIIALLLFTGCSVREDMKINEIKGNPIDTNSDEAPSRVPFATLHLLEAKHPELDFGISQHDGQRTIRDFVITEDGNLLLLELSDKVYEYSPKGELLSSYDFGFFEKELTAYMLTYDHQGNFYFVDGHNALIIKADKSGMLSTSSLGEKSIITEPGLIKNISALEDNILSVTAISSDDFLAYTYELDVSGEDAICIKEPQVGISLGNGLSYKNELLTNENGGLTDGISVTIYKNNIEKNKFEVHTKNNFIVGLEIYGVTKDGGYLSRVYEMLLNGNSTQETFVILDEQGKFISICDGYLKDDDIIRGYNDNTFVLRFETDGLIIFPLLELFTSSNEESWFKY